LNCALELVEEIILYYDARSKKHQIRLLGYFVVSETVHLNESAGSHGGIEQYS